jgi:hypothetical protein
MEGTMTATPRLTKSLTQVNTSDAGAVQNDGQIVSLNDGGYVAQRFDATGQKIGAEFTLRDLAGINDSPQAALLTDSGRIAYAIGDVSTGDDDVMTSIWRARDLSQDFNGDGKGRYSFTERQWLAFDLDHGRCHDHCGRRPSRCWPHLACQSSGRFQQRRQGRYSFTARQWLACDLDHGRYHDH